MLNYSIIYTNNLEISNADVYKYVCSDNKIHIRFKDFNKEEFLVGFEKKLTYLLSYLLNYSYIPKLVGKYSYKEILKSFLLDESVKKLIDFVDFINKEENHNNTVTFDGLLLKPNYKKDKNNYKCFGDIDVKFFPLKTRNNITEAGDLEFFLNVFNNITLYLYLFDDNYVVWLHNRKFKLSTKFETKKLRKLNKQANKNINIVELW